MGVKPIPVGGPNAVEFFKQRDWYVPFIPLFYSQPFPSTRGIRTATISQYKAWGRALYLTSAVGANTVYEIGESTVIPIPPDGVGGGTIYSKYFRYSMTMNQTSGNTANAAGECLQGFGIGSMGVNTPWIGQFAPSSQGTVIHVRRNITRSKWELFAANDGADVGTTVDLDIQPNFAVDVRIPEMTIEWFPETQTINISCNDELVHSQDMTKMLPNGGVFGSTGQIDLILFITNGSNAAYTHVEAGFYLPRFYQPISRQPVL